MREGKILNPEKLFFDEKGSADVQLDCKGCILAPGFIDVQINGEVRAAAPSAIRTAGMQGRSAGEAFLLPGCATRSWTLALLTPNASAVFWGWEPSGAAPVPCWAPAGGGALGCVCLAAAEAAASPLFCLWHRRLWGGFLPGYG